MDSADLLRLQVRRWGRDLADEQVAGLVRYARLLAGYREANVIGARHFDDVLLDHVLDSLSCLLAPPLRGARRLVDVGSGGGLPGIAISIVRPDIRVTLVEATRKKARFLRLAAERLALGNVRVLNTRVEEAARETEQRGTYDIATARALARLPVVAEYCIPLLCVGGCCISMKGRLDAAELAQGRRAATELGAAVEEMIRVPSPPELQQKERHLVLLRKMRATPQAYPRRVGVPSKQPLGVA